MHQIYKNIETTNKETKKDSTKKLETTNNKKKSDSVSVITKKEKDVLHIIYFDFDNYNLSDTSFTSLKKFIKEYENKIDTFLVVVHTDTKGTKEYNMKLSLIQLNDSNEIYLVDCL